MEKYEIQPIARIRNDFTEKFGIPRQAGIAQSVESVIVFEPEYRNPDSLRELETFSHIWLIWRFSESARTDWSPTVRPPRLGGNKRIGVFATRSPFRPNALGLSCVKLLAVEKTETEGTVLRVSGADLMNGTPIFDIKPYIPYADSVPDAAAGFAPDAGKILAVVFTPEAEAAIDREKLPGLREILERDPRPQYQHDGERIYTMRFGSQDIRFRVEDGTLTVLSAE